MHSVVFRLFFQAAQIKIANILAYPGGAVPILLGLTGRHVVFVQRSLYGAPNFRGSQCHPVSGTMTNSDVLSSLLVDAECSSGKLATTMYNNSDGVRQDSGLLRSFLEHPTDRCKERLSHVFGALDFSATSSFFAERCKGITSVASVLLSVPPEKFSALRL